MNFAEKLIFTGIMLVCVLLIVMVLSELGDTQRVVLAVLKGLV